MKSNPERKVHSSPVYQQITGERGAPVVVEALSLQTRLSNYIAFGLLAIIAVGVLLWYYSRTFTATRIRGQARQPAASRTLADDVALPSLGPIRTPRGAVSATNTPADASLDAAHASPAVELLASPLSTNGAVSAEPLSEGAVPSPASPHAASPSRIAFQRRTAGEAFLPSRGNVAAGTAQLAPATAERPSPASVLSGPRPIGSRADTDPLTALLSHASTPMEIATVLPTGSLLLPKGAFIDCTLETAIDSTLPGMTTCITATDTFGADGRVVLLERGTRLIGETRGQVQQGSARVFVLWTEARTPAGVLVPLDAPGADQLGRSGLPGQVDRHFWQRFGAAVLLSVIDGAVQAGVQASAADRGGAVIYNPGGTQDVMSEILRETISIPPSVRKSNGDRIQIFVARDVDFRDVYELRATNSAR